MDNYIHKLINYFFHHRVSDELKKRMYDRMLLPEEDPEREKAILQLWDEQERSACSEEELNRAYARLESRLGQRTIGERKGNRQTWFRVAAMWLVPFMMLGASAYLYLTSRNTSIEAPEITYVHHYAAVGTREKICLPDSSTVWLNAGSLLVYPSTLAAETRNVYLSGEGFFEVKKDSLHPFVVSTNYLQLQVLGTSFNVSAYPSNNQVKATLETGLLQVEVNGQQEKYILTPNEQLVYTPLTQKVEQLKVGAADYSDWRMGGLFFNDASFEDVLHTLERTYNIHFHVYTSMYQKQNLRVHFNKDESLENVLKIIQILIPGIEYQIDGKDVYLK